MTRKTTESYGKHANRAQIERRIKSEEISRRVNCHRIIPVCRCFLPLLSQDRAGTISLPIILLARCEKSFRPVRERLKPELVALAAEPAPKVVRACDSCSGIELKRSPASGLYRRLRRKVCT